MKQTPEENNIPNYFIGAYNPIPPTALAMVQERIDHYHGAITQVSTLEQKAFDSIRQYQMLREEYQGRIFLKRQEIEGYEIEKKEYAELLQLALIHKWQLQQGGEACR